MVGLPLIVKRQFLQRKVGGHTWAMGFWSCVLGTSRGPCPLETLQNPRVAHSRNCVRVDRDNSRMHNTNVLRKSHTNLAWHNRNCCTHWTGTTADCTAQTQRRLVRKEGDDVKGLVKKETEPDVQPSQERAERSATVAGIDKIRPKKKSSTPPCHPSLHTPAVADATTTHLSGLHASERKHRAARLAHGRPLF